MRSIPGQLATEVRGAPWRQTFAALRYPSFKYLWLSTLFTSGGNWIQQITVGWLAYELSQSALQVGLVTGLRTLPFLAGPVIGVVVDRMDRRRLLLWLQAFLAAASLGFAILILLDVHRLWHLYVFSGVMGIAWSFNGPVRQTLVANSVPLEGLMNAVALNSMAFNINRVLGPAVGGALIALFGPGLNFLLQALFYIGVFVMIVPYRPLYPSDLSRNRSMSLVSNLAEGVRYAVNERTIRAVLLVAAIPTLTLNSWVMTLLPVYAPEVLNVGPAGLGLLMTAAGVGGFIGALVVAASGDFRRKGLVVIASTVMTGLGIIVLSQVGALWMAMVLLVATNLFQMVIMTTNNTVIQMLTPDEMRGRVQGVYNIEFGLMPLGGMLAGALAEWLGVPAAFVVGSLAGLTLITLVATLVPALRRL